MTFRWLLVLYLAHPGSLKAQSKQPWSAPRCPEQLCHWLLSLRYFYTGRPWWTHFLMTAVYASPPVWSLARAVRLLRLIKAGTSRPVRNNKPSEVLTSSCSASKDGKILAAPPLCVCSPFIHSSLMLLFCLSFFSPAGFLYSYFCHDLNMLFSMGNQISCIYTNVKGTLLLSCIT